jgi:hypothetical protein
MEIVPSSAIDGSGGNHWRASTLAQGRPRGIYLLLEDREQGALYTQAYTIGTKCFLYGLLPGDWFNAFVDLPGTGTSAAGGVTVGEPLEANPDGNLTQLVSTTVPIVAYACEAISDTGHGPAGTLTWCIKA